MCSKVPFVLKVIFLLVFYFSFRLTMPKDTACCLTTNCYCCVAAILASSFKIVNPYSYCKKEGL
jgi:hypothetical protein